MLAHLLLYHLYSLCFLIDGSFFLQESTNNDLLLVSPCASGAPIKGRGCSPHGFFSELRFPPLYNLRRKYIQDIAYPAEDALGRSVKGESGTNRFHEIHAGVWRHCCPLMRLNGEDAVVCIGQRRYSPM